ncbi:hypothetical protein HK104_006472 [Borealophlyctis nickersoniae]|nr:hypothetical protein HK104_006472 [Borealophlyctis nickersoniae]
MVRQKFVKPGDQVEQFAKICEVQSDKAAVEITSRYDGVIAALHYKAGDVAKVGSPLVDIDAEAGEDSNDKSDDVSESQPDRMAPAPAEAISQDSAGTRDASASSSEDAASRNGWTLATPAVRRVARENGVNLNLVKGSGPGGRILKGDVLAYSAGLGKRAPETGPLKPDITADARTPPISHSTSISAGTTVQPLTAVQKAMFKTMTRTLSIPHFCYSDTISLDAVAVVRRSINDHLTKNAPKGKGAVDKYGGVTKISYMPIFIKALSIALKDYPILNACIVDGEDAATAKLKYREEHNIGVAMDTAQGLLVPNIKNVESKSIIEIASELSRLRTLSQSNALTPNDLSNGTITLSNIGIVGGTVLHPCLVPTELCIGAIGAAKRTPVFKVGEDGVERVVASSLMGVSFAADHRVIDGATLARDSDNSDAPRAIPTITPVSRSVPSNLAGKPTPPPPQPQQPAPEAPPPPPRPASAALEMLFDMIQKKPDNARGPAFYAGLGGGPRETPKSTPDVRTFLEGLKMDALPAQKGHLVLSIKSTKNNTLLVLNDWEGRAITKATAGTCGLKKSARGTSDAGFQAATQLVEHTESLDPRKMNEVHRNLNIQHELSRGVHLKVKGFGPGREQAFRAIVAAGWNIVRITDLTPIRHGGCRPRKPRRV